MSKRRTPCTLTESVVQDTVFHGTNVNFDRFDTKFTGTATDAGTLGLGFYFSSLETAAQSYAEWVVWKKGTGQPIVKRAKILLCAPYRVTSLNAPRNLENDLKAARRFTQGLRRQGYDGVIYTMDHRNIGGGVFHEYVAFDPTQIVLLD